MLIEFDPTTVGPAGLLLRDNGTLRQTCPIGHTQVGGNNLVNRTVPASRCGSPTGFDPTPDNTTWYAADSVQLWANESAFLLTLPKSFRNANPHHFSSDASRGHLTLRYLFADWPTPTVYDSRSYLGPNGQLPTPPFEMNVLM